MGAYWLRCTLRVVIFEHTIMCATVHLLFLPNSLVCILSYQASGPSSIPGGAKLGKPWQSQNLPGTTLVRSLIFTPP